MTDEHNSIHEPLFRAGQKVNVRRADGSIVFLGGTLEYGGFVADSEPRIEAVMVRSSPLSKWWYHFDENTGTRLVTEFGIINSGIVRFVNDPADPEWRELVDFEEDTLRGVQGTPSSEVCG